MKTNTKVEPIRTHEGGRAKHINPLMKLRRAVMSCLLWEREFYEDGEEIAGRIKSLVAEVPPAEAAKIAVEAREKMKLRHVPLWIVREMARLASHKSLVSATLARVIQRPDELMEFCSLWQRDDKRPLSKTLSAQAKKGLALAFRKFNAYEFGKWNQDGAIKLRDVLFLSHAKPEGKEQEQLFKMITNNALPTPDTWEVALSGGADKKETFTRLIEDGKLGALALLRNLRKMTEVGVEKTTIKAAISKMKTERVLPFRFIAAARYAPWAEPELEQAMFRCLQFSPKLAGSTVLLIDVSGSMNSALSGRSEMKRTDAAYGLAMLAREICEDVFVFSFSTQFIEIAGRRGFALRDAIDGSQQHGGTPLGAAIAAVYAKRGEPIVSRGHHEADRYRGQGLKPDRLIVITDEQSADPVPDPAHGKGYMINVASAKNGVGYGAWIHVDGWSEAVIDYISELERTKGGELE